MAVIHSLDPHYQWGKVVVDPIGKRSKVNLPRYEFWKPLKAVPVTRPKSPTLILPSREKKMLEGFRSLCIIFFL